MELEKILRQPEGKTLEFKRDLSSPEGVLKTIVAFGNTAGGIVLIGVESKTHRVVGCAAPLDTEERLANLVHDTIAPQLVPEIEILPWRSTHLIAVRVHPGATRPYYLKSSGPEAGVFVRVGSTNRRADSGLIAELRRVTLNESFDEQPMPQLGLAGLDLEAARADFASVRKLKQSDLRSLRLTTVHQGREVPTVGGILLFGKERLAFFPDAWIQLGRFRGEDRRQILDTVELKSRPVVAIEQAIRFVNSHLGREVHIGETRHTKRWTFPPLAVREAIINAVVHADYAQTGAPIRVAIFLDRIEVENPGLLPFGLTVEKIKKGVSRLRNRVIGRVFHTLGLIEQWGSGIQRMVAACKECGLPEPAFEELGTHFRVTFPLKRVGRPDLDAVEKKIIDLLTDGEGLSTSTIAKHIGLSPRSTRERLRTLVERGIIVEIGSGPRDPRRVYCLTEPGD